MKEVSQKKILSTNDRVDGFVDKGVDCSNSIAQEWTLIDEVEKIGDKKTDFVINKVPTLIKEYDIQEQINEAAKDATLEGQIAACLKAGGNPDIDFADNNPVYSDISMMPDSIIEAKKIADAGLKAKESLPEELQKENLTKEDLDAYINKVLEEKGLIKKKESSELVPEKKEEVKENE